MKPQSPCLDCTDRKANCHSMCVAYLYFREDLDKYNAHREKNKRAENDYYAVRNRKFK